MSAFSLARAVYEVRYPIAYRLWDRAGALAVAVADLNPKLVNKTAQPNQIVFSSDSVHVSLELSVMRVITKNPDTTPKVNEHGSFCARLERAVAEVLELTQFERVGARFIFARPFESREKAGDVLQQCGLLTLPQRFREHIVTGSKTTQPEIAFRVEGAAYATAYRLRTESQEVSFEPPFDVDFVDLRPASASAHVLVFDVDRYTSAPLSIGKIDAAEWVTTSFKSASRDREQLLGVWT